MGTFLATLALRYVTVAGAVVVLSVVGRGLLRAADHATQGDLGKAAEGVLAATVAPALMAYDSASTLVGEVAEAARELTQPTLQRAQLPR